MVIYGVALLSFCMLIGVWVGDVLGEILGANVGGVGIAMFLLLILSNLGSRGLALGPVTEKGLNFWSAMYIPIVVAMAARQDVVSALSGGWMAIIAGVAAVAAASRHPGASGPDLLTLGQGRHPQPGRAALPRSHRSPRRRHVTPCQHLRLPGVPIAWSSFRPRQVRGVRLAD